MHIAIGAENDQAIILMKCFVNTTVILGTPSILYYRICLDFKILNSFDISFLIKISQRSNRPDFIIKKESTNVRRPIGALQ